MVEHNRLAKSKQGYGSGYNTSASPHHISQQNACMQDRKKQKAERRKRKKRRKAAPGRERRKKETEPQAAPDLPVDNAGGPVGTGANRQTIKHKPRRNTIIKHRTIHRPPFAPENFPNSDPKKTSHKNFKTKGTPNQTQKTEKKNGQHVPLRTGGKTSHGVTVRLP